MQQGLQSCEGLELLCAQLLRVHTSQCSGWSTEGLWQVP